MTWGRGLLAGVGLLAFSLGTAAVLSPAVDTGASMAAAVALLGNDYFPVAIVGVTALVGTVVVLLERGIRGVDEATPPSVERVTIDSPDHGIDRTLGSLPLVRVTDHHARIHARLRSLAVDRVARRDRCSREAAERRIAERTWCDDPVATAFLADDTVTPPPLRRRLRELLGGSHWFRLRVRAVVTALESPGTGGNEGGSRR